MDLAYIPSPSESVWQLGPIPIRAYALCLLAGIVVACWIAEARMRRRGAPKWAVLDLAVWAVPFGIVGGRLYHVFTSPDAYFGADGDPWKIIAVWEGGLGIPGAVLLGALGVWFGCRQLKLPFGMVADAIVPGIPVAQAIGRLGNWFNQELYGKPLDAWWAVAIDTEHRVAGYREFEAFHPTFAYEAIWNLGVALVVWLADRKWKFGAGRAVALYVALYGIGRFWIEGLRIDPAGDLAGLRLNQWMSIIVVIAAVAYLLLARGRRQVLVLDGDALVPVPWDSEAAAKAGYVNGALPKGAEPTASTPEPDEDAESDAEPGDGEAEAASDNDGSAESTADEAVEDGASDSEATEDDAPAAASDDNASDEDGPAADDAGRARDGA
ncbi:prolipoprotein diacylglyceryl transferase [Glycomyces paridis]|uniref:Phosphatidylglycerol--prolipoprotein diacylglyceryl transferase n=1 Tax=Glycomyces paridis TaxID=2126555 RepID=A0A4S8PDG3_9ACTN|nr:prolipoprotein diacylglyceryl transferase [Glycomyces paridis]THV28413.1 prolipoprotein diacylglyceryl transferase [Glycomyces paridis]